MRAIGWAVMDGTNSSTQVSNPILNLALPDLMGHPNVGDEFRGFGRFIMGADKPRACLLYTSDAADE